MDEDVTKYLGAIANRIEDLETALKATNEILAEIAKAMKTKK